MSRRPRGGTEKRPRSAAESYSTRRRGPRWWGCAHPPSVYSPGHLLISGDPGLVLDELTSAADAFGWAIHPKIVIEPGVINDDTEQPRNAGLTRLWIVPIEKAAAVAVVDAWRLLQHARRVKSPTVDVPSARPRPECETRSDAPSSTIGSRAALILQIRCARSGSTTSSPSTGSATTRSRGPTRSRAPTVRADQPRRRPRELLLAGNRRPRGGDLRRARRRAAASVVDRGPTARRGGDRHGVRRAPWLAGRATLGPRPWTRASPSPTPPEVVGIDEPTPTPRPSPTRPVLATADWTPRPVTGRS